MRLTRAAVLVLSLLVIIPFTGCGERAVEEKEKEKELVAIINGEEISREEYDELLAMRMAIQGIQEPAAGDVEANGRMEALKQHLLRDLITQTVLLQEAEKAGVRAEEEKIEAEYERLKEQYSDENAFIRAMEEQKLTAESLKNIITRQLTIFEYIDGYILETKGKEAVEVPPEELQSLYELYSMQREDPPPFEEVKEELERMARQNRIQGITSKLVDELLQDSEIEIYLEGADQVME